MESENISRKIILIDDEPAVLNALSLLLKALGHEAKTFGDPKEAITFFQGEEVKTYDIIMCDLRMPEYDGLAVLKENRQHCPEIPFLLISGHAVGEDVEKATNLGAKGFLSKPFTPDQLHELFEEIL